MNNLKNLGRFSRLLKWAGMFLLLAPIYASAQIISPDTIRLGDPVVFSHNISSAVAQQWNFGDGNSSSLASPTHTYTSGVCNYSQVNISLTVTDAASQNTNYNRTVVLENYVPNPDLFDTDLFTPFSNCDNSPSISNPNFSISLQNITTDTSYVDYYTINWGDNTGIDTLSTHNFLLQHTYQSLGLFPFSITAYNSFGCSKTTNYTIANQSNPAVGLSSLGSTQGCAPQEFTFILSQYQSNSPGTYYVWNFGDGSPTVTWSYNDPYNNDSIKHVFQNTSCQNGQVSFTVSVTAYNYCDQTTATVGNIRIYSSPQAQFTSSEDTTCVNSTISFTNNTLSGFGYNCNGNAFYHWDFGDGSISTQSNPTHSYNAPGNYMVVLTATNGVCGTSQDSTPIVVNETPFASAQLSQTEACDTLQIQTTNLSTGGNLHYTWQVNPSSGWQLANGSSLSDANPEFIIHQKGIYSLSLSCTNNCGTDDTSFTLKVMQKPDVQIQTTTNYCGSAQFTPAVNIDSNLSAIQNIAWNMGNGTPAHSNAQNPGNISFPNPGYQSISIAVSNSCGTTTDSAQFTIFALPQVQSTSNASGICIGDTTLLQASGAQTYQWHNQNGNVLASTQQLDVNPAQTTTYYLTGQDSNQCVNTDSIEITVHTLPQINISSLSSQICLGDTLTLTATGAIQYDWKQNGNLLTQGSQIYHNPTQSGSIIVEGTDANQCSSSDTFSFQVFTPPTLQFSQSNPSICYNDSIQIQITGATNIIVPAALSQNGSNFTFAPGSSTNYQISAYDLAGCISDTTIHVEVFPLPAIQISQNTNQICLGDSIHFAANGGNTYQWSTGSTQNSLWHQATTSGTISVSGIDVNGCSNSDTASFQVKSLPNVQIQALSNGICQGDSFLLSAQGANTYQWQKGMQSFGSNPIIHDTLQHNAQFILQGSDANGCTNSDTINISVTLPPVIQSNLASNQICADDSTLLQLNGGSSYTINNQSVNSSTYLKPTSSTTYQIRAYNNSGCFTDSSIQVVVNALPSISISSPKPSACYGDSLSFMASGGQNYLWTYNNTNISNNSNASLFAQNSGSVTVKGTDAMGCSNYDTLAFTVYALPNVQINASSTQICNGDSFNLQASGANSYNWIFNSTPISSQSTYSNQLATNGTYILEGIDAHSCVNYDTIQLTAIPLPSINFALSSQQICLGDSAFLQLNGNYNYSINNQLVNAQNYFAPAINSSYQLKFTDSYGCSSDSTINISVLALPNVSIQTSGTAICLGDSLQFNGTGAQQYQWFNQNGIIGGGSNINFTPAQSGQLILKGVDNQGCINFDSLTYTVNGLPNIQISSSNTSICEGDSIHMHVSGAVNYDWYVNNQLVNTGNSLHQNLYSSQLYTVRGTDNKGCSNEDNLFITVHPKPQVSYNISNNELCFGDSVQVNFNGAQNYTINGISSQAQITLSPTSSGSYTLIGTDNYNCSDTTQFNLLVHALPQVQASTSNSSICLGQSTQLQASGASTYIWTPNANLSSQSGSTIQASPMQSTTYYLKGIDQHGCENTDSLFVQVSAQLSIQASANKQNVCMGDSVELSATGASTYQWTSGSGLLSNSGSNVYAIPQNTTNFVVTGTDINGCISTQTVSVNVLPLPNLNLNTSSSAICPSDSVNLSANGALNYTWKVVDGSMAPQYFNGNSFYYTPNQTSSITLTGIDSNQCVSQQSTTIVMKNNPIIQATSNKTAVCAGNPVQLFANGAQNYQWQGAGQISNCQSNNASAVPTQNQWFKVIGQANNGCFGEDSVFVEVLPLPTISAISSQADICFGDSVQIGINGNGQVSWIPCTGLSGNTGLTTNASPISTTQYTATLIDTNACENTTQITVNVHALPTADFSVDSIICKNANASFINQSTNTASFLWNFGDTSNSNSQNPNHSYSSVGYYEASLVAVSAYNCQDTISKVIHVIDAPQSNFSVYPQTGCSPLSINLTNTSSCFGGSRYWNTSDGQTSNQIAPQNFVLNALPGQDTNVVITLTTSNICGSSTHHDTVHVISKPVANFGFTQSSQCSPATATFGNISSSNTTSYLWDLGDTTYCTQAIPANHTYSTTNVVDFSIKLITNNSCGADTMVKTLHLNPNVVHAMFTPSAQQVCAPATINFSNYSNIQSIASWNFDDGNVSSSINPSHTYSSPGTYNVSLIVTDNCGVDTTTQTIVVSNPPVISFTTSADTICQNGTVNIQNLTSNLTNLQWDMGDNTQSSLSNFNHVYQQSGQFTIQFIGEDLNTHCTDTVSKVIHVNPSAQANFTVNNPDGCYPLHVQFTNQSASATYFTWDFDNGNTNINSNPSETFTAPGTYQVKLIADNFYGCSDTSYQIIKAYPRPTASYTWVNQTPCENPATISFNNTSTGACGYTWHFDNNQASQIKDPSINYSLPGTYNTSLIAYNSYLCSDTAKATINLLPIPIADFTVSPHSGCEGLAIQFTNNSQHSTHYEWNFDDGNTSQAHSPLNDYQNRGNYFPSLIAYNASGCSDTVVFTDTVKIYPKPIADFNWQLLDPSGSAHGKYQFTNLSVDANHHEWSFGDGSNSQDISPEHQYYDQGDYSVKLFVSNDFGCTDEKIKLLSVNIQKGLYIPTALAPNHPNPEVRHFTPVGKALASYHIAIYDSWGKMLWESSQLQDGEPVDQWTGLDLEGNPLPQGVYFWIAEAHFDDGTVWSGMKLPNGRTVKKGSVTLLR